MVRLLPPRLERLASLALLARLRSDENTAATHNIISPQGVASLPSLETVPRSSVEFLTHPSSQRFPAVAGATLQSVGEEAVGIRREPPKRPGSAWVRFLSHARGRQKGMPKKEFMGWASAQWKAMSEAERTPFVQAYKEEKAEYERALEEYKNLEGHLPSRPKRPLTSYQIFFRELREANSAMHGRALRRLSGQKWRAMSEEEKAVYKSKAAPLKEAYEKQMMEYSRADPSSPRLLGMEGMRLQVVAGEAVGIRGERPKRPGSAWVRFLSHARGQHKGMPKKEFMGWASAQWEAMGEAERAPVVQAHEDSKVEYKRALEEYKNLEGHPPSRTKRPLLPYQIFFQEFRGANLAMKYSDARSLAGEKWAAMAQEEREVYEAKAERLREVYQKQRIEYTARLEEWASKKPSGARKEAATTVERLADKADGEDGDLSAAWATAATLARRLRSVAGTESSDGRRYVMSAEAFRQRFGRL